MKTYFAISLGLCLAALTTKNLHAETVWLDDLNLAVAAQDWGKPQKNLSVEGRPLAIDGRKFEHGFGTHAQSVLDLKLDGATQSFSAKVGLDDEINKNPVAGVEFEVIGDGTTLW